MVRCWAVALALRIEPRLRGSTRLTLAVTAGAVGLGLVLGGVVLSLLGVSPLAAYRAMFSASLLGGAYALSDTAVKATPLLLCGLGCAVAFRARLWNVGAEGQLLLGAWAAVGVASALVPPDTPRPLMLGAMALSAATAGAAWGAVPGLLRAYLGVSEIISSLMLVYVAQQWIKYFVFGPWSEGGFPLTPMLPRSAWLPRLSDLAATWPSLSGLTAHLGLPLALGLAAALWVVLKKTPFGFEIKVLGDSERAARYMGIPVRRRMSVVMALSGALCGLGGMTEVAGVVHRLQDRFSPGYGFVAIAVAWLGRLSPAGVTAGAVLFGALLVGAKEVQPGGIALMLQGVLMLTVVAGEALLRYRVRLERRPAAGPPVDPPAGGPR